MSNKPVIKSVYLYYSQLKRPVLCYQKSEVAGMPFKDKEYVVDALLTAADLASLTKTYRSKGVKMLSQIKYFNAEAFTKRFKVAPPEGAEYLTDGEYAVIKFRKHAAYPDGKPNPYPPSVVGFKSLGNKSQNGYLIEGRETILGNGTKVNLQIAERIYKIPNSNSKGMSLDLYGIQVDTLVPYETAGLGFDDAGDVEDSDFDEAVSGTESEGFDDAGDVVEAEPEIEEEEEADEWDA
jgi:hypothetical protein